jgi:hypothetical protein
MGSVSFLRPHLSAYVSLLIASLLFCSPVLAAPARDVGDVAAESLQQAVTSGRMVAALDVWYQSDYYRLNKKASVYGKARRVTLQREASGLGALLFRGRITKTVIIRSVNLLRNTELVEFLSWWFYRAMANRWLNMMHVCRSLC